MNKCVSNESASKRVGGCVNEHEWLCVGKGLGGCEREHARVNELVRCVHVCGVHDRCRSRVCVCERRKKSMGTCIPLCACRHGCMCVSDVCVGVRGGEFTYVRLCVLCVCVCVCVSICTDITIVSECLCLRVCLCVPLTVTVPAHVNLRMC